MYSDDPVRDFDEYDRQQEKLLEKLPICDGKKCGKRITEYYYEVNHEILCESCMIRRYRRNINEY